MPIPLYGVQAHGGKILSLDDPAVVKDLAALNGSGGNAYAGRFRSTPLPGSTVLGWSRFRRFIQRVFHLGAATLKVTPYRDEQPTGQTITRVLAVSDIGVVTAPLAATGSAFQVEVEVSGFTAEVQLGDAEAWIVPRRSER